MTRRPTSFTLAFTLAFALGVLALPIAAAGPLPPQAPARAELYVLEDVRLTADGDPVKLVLSGGKIDRVLGAGEANPIGARVIDGAGGLVVPAFVDAYTHTGLETPEPTADRDLPVSTGSDVRVDMRAANRRGVQPAFRAVDAIALEAKASAAIREQGFGTLCIAPHGHLLSGASAVVTSREAALRDAVLTSIAFDHAELTASGGGYPSTLMGCMAQLRQFFLDASHHRELAERHAAGKSGPRPPFDAELEAIGPVLDGERPLVCFADSHRDIERWIGLSEVFGFRFMVVGGRDAWRVADRLAELEIPVVLTLDWPEEVKDPEAKKEAKQKGGEGEPSAPDDEAAEGPDAEAETEEASEEAPDAEAAAEDEAAEAAGDAGDADGVEPEVSWEYVEPLAIRRERRRLWEQTRDCAIALDQAGVRIAFGSGGDSSKQLLKRVRELVKAGLPAEVAHEALTSGGAALLGLERQVGGLEPGMIASIGVWTGDPVDKKSKLAWLFVDGFAHEYEVEVDDEAEGGPDEGVDATGTWTIEQEQMGQTVTSIAELEMTEEGEVTGTITMESPQDGDDVEAAVEGRVAGVALTLKGEMSFGETEVTFSMTGDIDGDAWSGTTVFKGPWGEFDQTFDGNREPPEGAEEDELEADMHDHAHGHGHPHQAQGRKGNR